MSGNMISKISNAFSTGGGGVNFEQRIQALFLLSLVIEGFCPVVNEQTKRVCFQAKHLGFNVDDLVIYTYRDRIEGKLLIQIKHSITVTKNDRIFQEVISAAWSDFSKENFDKRNDRIALATAQISTAAQQSLRFLHASAEGAVDECEFIEKLNLKIFSSENNRKIYTVLEYCIEKIKGCKPTDYEMWMFCRTFVLLLFDMDCEESINRALSSSLIKSNCVVDDRFVWSKIIEYAGYCNQMAASIDINNIDQEILDLFSRGREIKSSQYPIKEIDTFIITIALVGAWKEDNIFDRNIIEVISGVTYSEFEVKARSKVIQHSEYLRLSNGYWKVLHQDFLLEQCKEKIFDDILERLLEAAQNVLRQKNKQLINRASHIVFSEYKYENSLGLRKCILNGICCINKMLPEMRNCNQNKVKASIYELMRFLLEGADWITWASLGDGIQRLAELAPKVFLEQIEHGISQRPLEILNLFPKKDSSLLESENYICELLWALEILAWSPEYLVRTICVLGLMEDLPYERTNRENTPINSIVSILLPWYPQTVADAQKKNSALQCLKNDTPEVFWRVLRKLLNTNSAFGNPRPKYLPIKIPKDIEVPEKEIQAQYTFLLELATDTASENSVKISELVSEIEYMNESTLIHFLNCIEIFIREEDEHKFGIWLALLEKMAVLQPTEGTAIYKQIKRIRSLIHKIEPRDIRWKYRSVYLANYSLIYKGDSENIWEKLESDKLNAIKEIYNQFGILEIEKFGRDVNNIANVAGILGTLLNLAQISHTIELFHSGELSPDFALPCIESFVGKHGAKSLLNTTLNQKEGEFILKVLSRLQFNLDLLEVVNLMLGSDNLYWEQAVLPFGCRDEHINEVNLIMEKLTVCKRYVAAINLLGRSEFESVVNPNTVRELLIFAGTEESLGNDHFDLYAVRKILKWFQNRDDIELEDRSDVEFIYLPVFDYESGIQPRSLNTRLSLSAEYFCSIIEMYYKKKGEDKNRIELSEGIKERLIKILFKYNITPGVDWYGVFDEEKFKQWVNHVEKWSKANDRYAVTMQTVGSGVSYAPLDGDKLPNKSIIELLNKIENTELRRGYYLGIINQRGMHYVDPKGTPELEIAADYNQRAAVAESRGYSRYANVLYEVAGHYQKEAEHNILVAQNENEEWNF